MSVELTEREIAICQGKDPDCVETAPEQEASSGTVVSEGQEDSQAGQDASQEAEGKDALSESTSEEADSGKPDAEVTDSGSGAKPDSEASKPESSWIDDTAKELGKSYGFSEDDLKSFKDADEFRRAGAMFDRILSRQKPEEKAVETKPTEAETDKLSVEKPEAKELDPEKLRENGYDEYTVQLVETVKAQQAQLAELSRYHAEQEKRRQLDTFHSMVDGLDTERYGRSSAADGVNKAQDDNRRKLFEAARLIEQGYVAQARSRGEEAKPIPFKTLLARAEMLEFGEEIRDAERKKVERDLAEQAKRKRGVSAGKQADRKPTERRSAQPQDIDSKLQEILNNPEVTKAWEKANGT